MRETWRVSTPNALSSCPPASPGGKAKKFSWKPRPGFTPAARARIRFSFLQATSRGDRASGPSLSPSSRRTALATASSLAALRRHASSFQGRKRNGSAFDRSRRLSDAPRSKPKRWVSGYRFEYRSVSGNHRSRTGAARARKGDNLASSAAALGESEGRWLFEPGNAEALCKSLQFVLTISPDALNAFRQRGIDRTRRIFSKFALQFQTLTVYDRLLGTQLAEVFKSTGRR